jgi:hypothetical protein
MLGAGDKEEWGWGERAWWMWVGVFREVGKRRGEKRVKRGAGSTKTLINTKVALPSYGDGVASFEAAGETDLP